MELLRLFDPTTQFQTKSGALNVAGKLRIYAESTDDLANIYDDDGSLLSQPLILDSNGRARGLFVDSGRYYRLEVYDRNDSLLFTIPNMAPNSSGAISGITVITSEDGSISVERTADGYDLSAKSVAPSVMLLSGRTLSNGTFVMDAFDRKSGDSIYLDNNFLKVNRGYYHVDARVSVSWDGPVESRIQVLTLSSTPTGIDREFDLSYAHSESIELCYDFYAPSDGNVVSVGIAGLVDGMSVSMTGLDIHEVKGQSAYGGDNDKVAVDANAEPGYLENVLVSDSDIVSLVKLGNVLHVQVNTSLDNKKDKQTSLEFPGSATKTVKKITQNVNGELNVEFEDIDFNKSEWLTLTATPYDSTIELLIMNAAYKDGLLFFNGTVHKKDGQPFNTNAVNYLFYINGVQLALDFRNYYGSGALNSASSLFPCAMAALKGNNLFYIYPTQECNTFYFNAVVPVVKV